MVTNQFWEGKKKYKYKLFKNSKQHYHCVSTKLEQSEVVEYILNAFTDNSSYYKLFCNEILIKDIKPKKTRLKSKYER